MRILNEDYNHHNLIVRLLFLRFINRNRVYNKINTQLLQKNKLTIFVKICCHHCKRVYTQ